MFKEGIYYSIAELEITQSIISLIGEEVSVEQALEIYEEIEFALFD